ncbi:outer membrane beta-barrel protein [uncultured Muriicola sp.]|uniref:outer membrane beta-barrel protein n=1 Tax=uncultured Muriicola sp. TaxID=1583102 RepID=UPI00260525C4|nr:outer membrane beta-barrel protein [uncultured Muriicola sp.]
MRNAFYTVVVLFFLTTPMSAQEVDQEVDFNYLEDQFYVGLTYNFILNKPADVNQQNLSYGLQFGFIKDLPLNSSRTFAIGVGLGYAVNSYYTNLEIVELTNDFQYVAFILRC